MSPRGVPAERTAQAVAVARFNAAAELIKARDAARQLGLVGPLPMMLAAALRQRIYDAEKRYRVLTARWLALPASERLSCVLPRRDGPQT